jgi:hypothetical protein
MSSNNLKEKIALLDQVQYKTSNVDEMKRVLFYSKRIHVKAEDLPKVFKFIITEIMRIDKVSDMFQGYVADNDKYIVEEYIENKVLKIAYLKSNIIYRTQYEYVNFLGVRKLKYTVSLKRTKRLYGASDYFGKYY